MAESKATHSSRLNPFKPGSIAAPGMFAGRGPELKKLTRSLHQTKSGSPSNFLIQGERGIGKSSLLNYLQKLSTRKVVTESGMAFNFLTASLELSPTETQESLIAKIGAALKDAATENKRVGQLLTNVWDVVKRWEVAGVKYNDTNNTNHPTDLLRDLTATLVATEKSLGEEYDGVLFLIDEADKAPASAHLGANLKLISEHLAKKGSERVAFGLFGLPEVVERLKESHESALRLFEYLTLEPLHASETDWAIRKGLDDSRERCGILTTIDAAASKTIAALSEGYPHFIQQFSYSAFNHDSDFNIDLQDVVNGAFEENGAFHQLGVQYFRGMYFEKIRSDDYRSVLRVMCKKSDGWVTKKEIREETGLKETTLTNAINALKTKHVIIPKEGLAGVYRLPSRAFAVWVGAYTGAIPEFAMPQAAPEARKP